MKIGILQTGHSPDEIRVKHGDSDDQFKKLLANRGFEFVTFAVLDGVMPNSIDDADGWLITGSKFGAYEDHDWIPPLESLLREIYAAKKPIVGVCFGHQILAQALGGTVEKFSGGWSVGATEYTLSEDNKQDRIMAWHQDQVTKLPKDATVIGSSDFCQYAMLAYGDTALTVQPHPEFTSAYVEDLLVARRGVLPKHLAEQAKARLDAELTSLEYADKFEAFFKKQRA